jgi:hypothetical protein
MDYSQEEENPVIKCIFHYLLIMYIIWGSSPYTIHRRFILWKMRRH